MAQKNEQKRKPARPKRNASSVLMTRVGCGLLLLILGAVLVAALILGTAGSPFTEARTVAYGLFGVLAPVSAALSLWGSLELFLAARQKAHTRAILLTLLAYVLLITAMELLTSTGSRSMPYALPEYFQSVTPYATGFGDSLTRAYTWSASNRAGGGAGGMLLGWLLWKSVGCTLGGVICILGAVACVPFIIRLDVKGITARVQAAVEGRRQAREQARAAWDEQQAKQLQQQRQMGQRPMPAQNGAQPLQTSRPMPPARQDLDTPRGDQAQQERGRSPYARPVNDQAQGNSPYARPEAASGNANYGFQPTEEELYGVPRGTNSVPEAAKNGLLQHLPKLPDLFGRKKQNDGRSRQTAASRSAYDRQGYEDVPSGEEWNDVPEEEQPRQTGRAAYRDDARSDVRGRTGTRDAYRDEAAGDTRGRAGERAAYRDEAQGDVRGRAGERAAYRDEAADDTRGRAGGRDAYREEAAEDTRGRTTNTRPVRDHMTDEDQGPARRASWQSGASTEERPVRADGRGKPAGAAAARKPSAEAAPSAGAARPDEGTARAASAPQKPMPSWNDTPPWEDPPEKKDDEPVRRGDVRVPKTQEPEPSAWRAQLDLAMNKAGMPTFGEDEAAREEAARKARIERERRSPSYVYPGIELLRLPPERTDISPEEDELRARRLEETLRSFRVDASVRNITHGPAITRFELELAPGINVNNVSRLNANIAMNMEVKSVRIEAPIPGKALVGIEVPNRTVSTVTLREVLESEPMARAKGPLVVALGKDIAGASIVMDLARMPHLLIAGATGSGKSVCINTIINSLLFRCSPKEVRMILVDPKVVELQCYNGVPHLLIPVVSDPHKAAGALAWAVGEMMDRYRRFQEKGVRAIDGYNAARTGDEEFMPRIVIIIDELADLMMTCKKDVEDHICRIAQLARAAGIHLIVATQRPSVDVITGLIKANIPSRIAFKVTSNVDSRTILDHIGAEQLLGWGDMLYQPTGSFSPTRVQGCFLSDEEVNDVTDFLREHCPGEADPDILEQVEQLSEGTVTAAPAPADAASDETEDSDRPLLEQCIELAVREGQVSTSQIQRRFRVGYARAGRLVDEMEARGILSQRDGAKPRMCLISMEEWEKMRKDDFSDEEA